MNFNSNNYAGLGYTNLISVFYGGTNTLGLGPGFNWVFITNIGAGTLWFPLGQLSLFALSPPTN